MTHNSDAMELSLTLLHDEMKQTFPAQQLEQQEQQQTELELPERPPEQQEPRRKRRRQGAAAPSYTWLDDVNRVYFSREYEADVRRTWPFLVRVQYHLHKEVGHCPYRNRHPVLLCSCFCRSGCPLEEEECPMHRPEPSCLTCGANRELELCQRWCEGLYTLELAWRDRRLTLDYCRDPHCDLPIVYTKLKASAPPVS